MKFNKQNILVNYPLIVSSYVSNCFKKMDKLLKKYREIKKDFLNRSPRGKWLWVRNAAIIVLTVTGVPAMDPQYKVDWWSYAPLTVVIDIFISFIYTIWYYSDNPLEGILAIPTFAIIIPV